MSDTVFGDAASAGDDSAGDPCADGVRNFNETGIDCGGAECSKCVDTVQCAVDDDCRSGVCQNATCAPSMCGNETRDNFETGVDCGGPCQRCDQCESPPDNTVGACRCNVAFYSPLPDAMSNTAVWSVSPNDLWVTSREGRVSRWDGERWRYFYLGTRPLYAVAGSAANDVWLASSIGEMWHWDGSTVTIVETLGMSVYGLWALANDDAWAVGPGGMIWRWNGTTWGAISSGTSEQLNSVWASAANDVWILGDSGTVLRWDGSELTPLAQPFGGTMLDTWGTSANDVWLTSEAAPIGELLHYNGVDFEVVRTPSQSRLFWVSGHAVDDIWAASGQDMVHWDGNTWTRHVGPYQATIGAFGYERALTTPAGSFAVMAYRDRLWAWDGASWKSAAPANEWLGSASGIASGRVWAVGNRTIVHWDGARWSATPQPVDNPLIASVWGIATNDVWIGTNLGAYHYDGLAWSPFGAVPSHAMWGTTTNNLWAVGARGEISHWNGAAWTATVSSTMENLSDVWGTADDDVWAVGEGGAVVHYDGSNWEVVTTPATQDLHAVYASGPDDVWIGGDGLTAYHFNGSTWAPHVVSSSGVRVNSLRGGAFGVWAGTGNSVHRWNGNDWDTIADSACNIKSANALWQNSTDLWVFGAQGQILRYAP